MSCDTHWRRCALERIVCAWRLSEKKGERKQEREREREESTDTSKRSETDHTQRRLKNRSGCSVPRAGTLRICLVCRRCSRRGGGCYRPHFLFLLLLFLVFVDRLQQQHGLQQHGQQQRKPLGAGRSCTVRPGPEGPAGRSARCVYLSEGPPH